MQDSAHSSVTSALKAANAEHCGFVMRNLRAIQLYAHWFKTAHAGSPVPSSLFFSRTPAATTTDVLRARTSTAEWLALNLAPGAVRHHRQDHLFLSGPSETGKSSLINVLAQRRRVYRAPRENFFCGFVSGSFDLAVFDEVLPGFCGIDAGTINLFCDGTEMTLRTKGGSVLKEDNLPCIFISNHSIAGLFPSNPTGAEAFRTRMVVVEFQANDRFCFLDPRNSWVKWNDQSSSSSDS